MATPALCYPFLEGVPFDPLVDFAIERWIDNAKGMKFLGVHIGSPAGMTREILRSVTVGHLTAACGGGVNLAKYFHNWFSSM